MVYAQEIRRWRHCYSREVDQICKEATARKAHVDMKNPHLSIEPFTTVIQGRRCTKETVKIYISAVRTLYRKQRSKLGQPCVKEDLGFKEVSAILNDYKDL